MDRFFFRFLFISVTLVFVNAQAFPAQAQILAQTDERGIPTIAPLLQKITDAVVNIAVVSEKPIRMNPLFNDPFFRRYFDFPERMEPQRRLSAGSGVVIDAEKGYILTNHHVIENGVEITVTLNDRRNFKAVVIGSDSATDIALLKIDPSDLTALQMGDSSTLRVGDFVVAVGNPFGLGQTVTSGIISALDRSGINPEGFEDFIQTDASINPGNSGGALVTLDGNLVGINSAIIAPSGGNVGIGFAVPINMAQLVMEQLIEYGEVRRGLLGVSAQDLTPDLAAALDLDTTQGAIIVQVEPGSAAEKAGLLPGDIVIDVDGESIDDSGDLRNMVGLTKPGETLWITLLRDGELMTLDTTIDIPTEPTRTGVESRVNRLTGAEFKALSSGMQGFGIVEGVSVVSVLRHSPAANAGLRAGDVIMAVNKQKILTVEELFSALPDNSSAVALTIFRGGTRLYLIIR
ncbi:DegQ family serine endoprotease [Pseudohalocynthiibacter aestuariivivens]|uniref:DegQ family serine endoprotease n=1 Tax=Pseudohalocynthiibacter aestuariivivens TaxID=1591409 RepID=A0ABV5JDY6_9RHOB|nr:MULTISPECIES: DegQ family serine endoprotease [Pseudohalocynthiibacter]MBS9718085.1 DegQ family serine endoprotease [Pseudohalocynthiibacter aestuariivivens]MCK0103296.1 DegQ family serine endoprotease [Pseudohalocynthiibacter sp. F2068]